MRQENERQEDERQEDESQNTAFRASFGTETPVALSIGSVDRWQNDTGQNNESHDSSLFSSSCPPLFCHLRIKLNMTSG